MCNRTQSKSIERLEFDYRSFDWLRSLNVVWAEKKADANAKKTEQTVAMHSSKPRLPSFSLYSKVLMSITLLRFKFQNATKLGNYLRFSIFCLGLLIISRRRREVQWQNWDLSGSSNAGYSLEIRIAGYSCCPQLQLIIPSLVRIGFKLVNEDWEKQACTLKQ